MLNNFNKLLLILFPILTVCIFFNVYYEGVIYKLNNIQSVIIFCLLSLLIIKKNSFNFHKETLIVYIFILICFISCFFSENIFLSLKRFIIVFIPFVIIFQTYLNVENVDNIKNKKFINNSTFWKNVNFSFSNFFNLLKFESTYKCRFCSRNLRPCF